MKKFLCISCVMWLVAVASEVACAGDVAFDIEAGAGLMAGYTRWQIGGQVGFADGRSGVARFPISELEFPLDVSIFSVDVSAGLGENWVLNAGAQSNIDDDAGATKDSDWGFYFLRGDPWGQPNTLDIYSESESALDALIADVNVQYRILEQSTLSLFLGAGFLYQNFDYDLSSLDQWYPSSTFYFGEEQAHDYTAGLVAQYEVTYYIPYVLAAAEYLISEKFSVRADVGFSPYVRVEDSDSHILRGRESEGECEGFGVLISLEGRYNFASRWYLAVELAYNVIATDGTQETFENGQSVWQTDEEIESSQISGLFTVGVTF